MIMVFIILINILLEILGLVITLIGWMINMIRNRKINKASPDKKNKIVKLIFFHF
jgi:hypothetical protein